MLVTPLEINKKFIIDRLAFLVRRIFLPVFYASLIIIGIFP